MQIQSLGQEDALKEGMATHSNIPAWRIPWTKKPGELQSTGSQRDRYDWSDLACRHIESFLEDLKENRRNMGSIILIYH